MHVTHRSLVNPEPITLNGLKKGNPQMIRIYTGKSGTEPQYTPYAEEREGSAIKNIYQKTSKHPETVKKWVGKICQPIMSIFRNDPSSLPIREKKEIAADCIREKLASDLYQELGRGLFVVPKTRLSMQPLLNPFTDWNPLVPYWISMGVTDCLRIMSRFIEGYQDFTHAQTQEDSQAPLSFMEFLRLHHKPPHTLLTPEGTSVPLKGIMSLLAVSRLLADVDVLGGAGGNAGFIWIKDHAGAIIGAQVVKIDPGFCFSFSEKEANWVTGIQKQYYVLGPSLTDLRDLQTSTQNRETIVRWNCLDTGQKEEFLSVFLNSTRYLKSEPVFSFLFHREGIFNRSSLEQMPTEFLNECQANLKKWVQNQLNIYQIDLVQFKKVHPEQLLRIHYIDNWGELPLPMTEETFPVRELFVSLKIVKKKSSSSKNEKPSSLIEIVKKESSSSKNEKPSSLIDRDRAEKLETIELTELFQSKQGQRPSHVLLTGRAGIGKSTLCQKIAHDWASGRLWNQQFEVIYWIPLRTLNQKELLLQNGKPCMGSLLWTLLLNQQVEESEFIAYVEKTKEKSLWLIDGYDEASPELQHVVQMLLQNKEMSFLITSRPEAVSALSSSMDLHVENVGFSEGHIKTYVEQFFSQKLIKIPALFFLNRLRQQNHLFEIASIPLHLQMLCSLWEKNQEGFSSSLSGLYQQMVQQMLKWGQHKFEIRQSDALLLMLGKIAEQGLMLNQLLLPKETLERALASTSLRMKDLLATGLVKESDGGYTFIHLSFQEYLAAYRIAELSSEEIKSYIVEHRDLDSHQLVLPFLCGILHQRSSESSIFFFEAFFSKQMDSEEESKNLKLALKCLNECPGSISIPTLGDALARFSSHLSGSSYWERWNDLVEDLSFLSQTMKYLYHKKWYAQHQEVEEITLEYFSYFCQDQNLELVQFFYEKEPTLFNKTSSCGYTLLHLAARDGHLEMAQWLYEKIPLLLNKNNEYGKTPLHLAAEKHDDLEMAQWLYEKDPLLLHKTDNNGDTPLHLAINQCNFEMAQWLYEKDPLLLHKTDNNGTTPFHLALQWYRLEMARWLYKKDPLLLNKTDRDGRTPLHLAIKHFNNLETPQWLYEKDPKLLNKTDNNGDTPLHLATKCDYLEMAQWLYEKDPLLLNKTDNDGNTALHSAILNGKLRMAQWLYEKDPHLLNKTTNKGHTPLHLAAYFGELLMVQWICELAPEQCSVKDNSGQTPIQTAQKNGKLDVVSWLQANHKNDKYLVS